MAAQPAVKPQMHSAASTASQQGGLKGNCEGVYEGFRFAEKKFYSLTEKRRFQRRG